MTASYNGEVRIWNKAENQQSTICSFHNPVFNVAFSPSGNQLLITGVLSSFYIYKIEGCSAVQEYDAISINEREKQFDSTTSVPMNSGIGERDS